MTGKKILVRLAMIMGSLLVVAGALAPAAEAASQVRDCVQNSIMWCGAFTKSEFESKLANGDGHNSAANLQQIFYHEGRGFAKSDFVSDSTVDGTAFKDGRIVVSVNVGTFKAGQVVATGAVSVGRDQMSGSVRSGSVWETANQTAFVANSIPAFVNMSGGKFHWFVIKSCGNIGSAKAVAVPVPSIAKSPVVVKPTTVVINNKQVVNVSQQQQQQQAPAPATTMPVPAPTTTTQQQSQVLGAATSLPATGPEAALGGAAGIGAIAYATRAYLRSRKSLHGALRGRRDDN